MGNTNRRITPKLNNLDPVQRIRVSNSMHCMERNHICTWDGPSHQADTAILLFFMTMSVMKFTKKWQKEKDEKYDKERGCISLGVFLWKRMSLAQEEMIDRQMPM